MKGLTPPVVPLDLSQDQFARQIVSIEVTCQCGRTFRAKDADAGKRGKCPGCGAYFRIPQASGGQSGAGSVYGSIKPKCCLTVLMGSELRGEHLRLRRSRVNTIGKAPDNAIPLPDPRVSRHHCRISWTEKGWLIEDLKSTNGTYVNGQKIESKLLDGGERIEVGGFELKFEAPCEQRAQPARLQEQLDALKSGDPESSQAAMEFLASCGATAADHIVPRLSGFDTISGHLAMEVIEKLGPDAVPALILALKDKDKLRRSSAARALGKLGSQSASAVPDLLQALDDQDPTVYAEVAWALGQIGSAAVPGLLKALSSTERTRRISAAWTLGRIGPDANQAVPILSELAQGQDPEVSQVATAALKQIGPPQVNA